MQGWFFGTMFGVPRAVSSAGRALHLQCRGQRFDPATVHQNRVTEGFTEALPDKNLSGEVSANRWIRFFENWIESHSFFFKEQSLRKVSKTSSISVDMKVNNACGGCLGYSC
jgi:hypothetical protein